MIYADNIKLISFDCYGTLINWEQGMRNAFENFLTSKRIFIQNPETLSKEYIQIELDVEKDSYRRYKDVLRISTKKLFNRRNIFINSQDENMLVDELPQWQPFSEVRKVLNKLKSKGYKLAILSNIDEDLIISSIKLMHVNFDFVITAEQVGSYKPSSGHWEYMIKKCNIPKEAIVHVAASLVHDIHPAVQLGFHAIWINRLNENNPSRYLPTAEFKDLRMLLSIL